MWWSFWSGFWAEFECFSRRRRIELFASDRGWVADPAGRSAFLGNRCALFCSSEGERVAVETQGLFARCVRACVTDTRTRLHERASFLLEVRSRHSQPRYCVVSRAWENRLLSLTELFYSGWGIGHSNRVLRMPREGCREHMRVRDSHVLSAVESCSPVNSPALSLRR